MAGVAADQATKEKIVLCCGNVSGVAKVNDMLTVEQPADESRYYTVVKGDTLSAIAKKEYGNANAYMKIFEANKPMLSNPDKIYPGQLLRIPAPDSVAARVSRCGRRRVVAQPNRRPVARGRLQSCADLFAARPAPMLAYRHAFHAGNHADVLKHTVLTLVLRYMNAKDKPYRLVDTHAGAGGYSLEGPLRAEEGRVRAGHRAAVGTRRPAARRSPTTSSWCASSTPTAR